MVGHRLTAPNRITPSGATPARLLAALALVVLLAALAGCGGGGSTTSSSAAATTPSPSGEESADAAILDTVLGRQEAAVEAFAAVGPAMAPRLAKMAAYFRAQEQEHADALLKALRGLKSPAEPVGEAIDASGLGSDRERLVFLYEVESATIDAELSAISELEASWPRSLLASTVGNQSQHLTLLRQALGEGPLASVPVPFENGTAEAPAE
jgi:hypothetical protein